MESDCVSYWSVSGMFLANIKKDQRYNLATCFSTKLETAKGNGGEFKIAHVIVRT